MQRIAKPDPIEAIVSRTSGEMGEPAPVSAAGAAGGAESTGGAGYGAREGGGRPKDGRKPVTMSIYTTPEIREAIKRAAFRDRMSIAQWMIKRCMDDIKGDLEEIERNGIDGRR